MNWFPLFTFAGGVLGAIGFEMVGPWFSKRWSSSFDSGQWCAMYWLIVGTLLVCTIGHSVRPEDVPEWAPLIVVALLHVAIHLYGYLERDQVEPTTGSGIDGGSTGTHEESHLSKEASNDDR